MDSKWHRDFVNFVQAETGCSSENAGMVLGRMIELVMSADREGYIRGYNNGVADTHEKYDKTLTN